MCRKADGYLIGEGLQLKGEECMYQEKEIKALKSGSSEKHLGQKKTRLEDRLLEVLDEYWMESYTKLTLNEMKLTLTMSYSGGLKETTSVASTWINQGKLRQLSCWKTMKESRTLLKSTSRM